MELIGLNEGRKVIGVWRGDDMQWIFIELKIRFFPNSKTLMKGEIPALLLSFSFLHISKDIIVKRMYFIRQTFDK